MKRHFLTLSVLCVGMLIFFACGDNNNPSPSTVATYNVSFNSNGGTAVDSQIINSGSKATKPANPTKLNYTFVDWYKDSTLLTPFDFNSAITTSLTLYAKWTAIPAVPLYVSSYVLPTQGIAGLTDSIRADIDEANLTITVPINIAQDKINLLSNLTPVVQGGLGASQSALITNYNNAKARGVITEIGTYTLTASNGKTKTYKIKLLYASVVLKADFTGVSGISYYDVEIYKGDGYINSYGKIAPRYEKIEKLNINAMPYIYADTIPVDRTFFGVVYAKDAGGAVLAAQYIDGFSGIGRVNQGYPSVLQLRLPLNSATNKTSWVNGTTIQSTEVYVIPKIDVGNLFSQPDGFSFHMAPTQDINNYNLIASYKTMFVTNESKGFYLVGILSSSNAYTAGSLLRAKVSIGSLANPSFPSNSVPVSYANRVQKATFTFPAP